MQMGLQEEESFRGIPLPWWFVKVVDRSQQEKEEVQWLW
jgi:hypothetical protein